MDQEILYLANEALEGGDLAAQLLQGISPLTEAFRRFSEASSFAAEAFRRIALPDTPSMEHITRQLHDWNKDCSFITHIPTEVIHGSMGTRWSMDYPYSEFGGYLPQERVDSFLKSNSYIDSVARSGIEFSTNINEDVMDLDIERAVREEIQRVADSVTADLLYGHVTAEQAIREAQDKTVEAALAFTRQFRGPDWSELESRVLHGTNGKITINGKPVGTPDVDWESVWKPDYSHSPFRSREMTLLGMPVIESDLVFEGGIYVVPFSYL